MKKSILTVSIGIFVGLLLTACGNTADEDPLAVLGPDFAKKYDDKVITHYQCGPDNKEIEVRYFPTQGVAVLVLDGTTHELQDHVTASGFWFTNGKYTVRGKGDSMWLEIGRMAPIECQTKS